MHYRFYRIKFRALWVGSSELYLELPGQGRAGESIPERSSVWFLGKVAREPFHLRAQELTQPSQDVLFPVEIYSSVPGPIFCCLRVADFWEKGL